MEYFVLSLCFGLYIGHHQVSIKLIKGLYTSKLLESWLRKQNGDLDTTN